MMDSLLSSITTSNMDDSGIINSKRKAGYYAHFSVDDCLFWVDLIKNSDNYKTIFENKFLADLRELHKTFGCVFSLFIFLEDCENHLFEQMPSTFATEFVENKSWLKFGFHGRAYTSNYSHDDGQDAKIDYSRFTTGIMQMTGDIQTIDHFTRLSGFGGSLAACLALRDAKAGIWGLYTADMPDRKSYYLSEQQIAYMYNHCHYFDSDNQLHFVCSQMRLERSEIVPSSLNTLDFANYLPVLEFFFHESAWSDVLKEKIRALSAWLSTHDYVFDFPENIFR